MPFKSEAQRRLFWAKVNRGEIKRPVAEEWERATPPGKLPERVKSASFVDEMLKLSEGGESLPWGPIAGATAGALLGTAGFLAAKPMIRAHYLAKLRSIGKGGARAAAERQALPPQVVEEAKVIAKSLLSKGVDPAKVRIGISGTPGTGKTTMAKALSEELGMAMGYADEAGRALHSRALSKHVAEHGAKPGFITEQTRLLNTADPDKFDILIRMHKPLDVIKGQMKERGRGAAQWDFYDYKKLHSTIEDGFNYTRGQAFSPTKGVEIKIRPEQGFQANQLLDDALMSRGIKPEGLTREQKLLSITSGERVEGGQSAFVRKRPIIFGAGAVAGGSAAGALAGHSLSGKEKAGSVMAAFADEFLKLSEEEEPNWWQRNKLKALAGLGGAALGAGGFILAKPTLRKHVAHDISSFFKGMGSQTAERSSALPQQAVDDATKIVKDLAAQGVDFTKARIAVSGAGGTGKSTIARAIGEQTGMGVLHLDDVGKTATGRDVALYLEKNKVPKGAIAEQTHLIPQVDPDKFDVLIHIHKDPEVVKSQLLSRRRGAGQWEIYDYRKKAKAIKTSFEMTDGVTHSPVAGVEFKVKPSGGFKADEILNIKLKGDGINPEGMSRQEKVIAASTGSKPVLPGLLPYVRLSPAAVGAASVGGGAAAGAGGVHLYDVLQNLPKEE